MQHFKLFLQLFIFLCTGSVFAQEVDSIAVDTLTKNTELTTTKDSTVVSSANSKTDSIYKIPENSFQTQSVQYPPIRRDYRRLAYDTGLYLGVTVIAFGILWVMPESTTGWDRADIQENGITDKWLYNVKKGPVMDTDDWVLNYVTHPYSGAVYYMTARSSGFTIVESFGYSALMSTFFWEYGVEAFAEVPSIQDLIITPVLGSVMGEGFFYAKKSILKSDKRILKSKVLGVTALILMDPFNTFLDAVGYTQKVKTQVNVTPVGFDYKSNTTIWGLNLNVKF